MRGLPKEEEVEVTGLMSDPGRNVRAAYVLPSEHGGGGYDEQKFTVLAWGVVDGVVRPLRMDRHLGRMVVVGTEDDPHAEAFFGLLKAGEGLVDLGEDVDVQVREYLRGVTRAASDEDVEVDDAEADED